MERRFVTLVLVLLLFVPIYAKKDNAKLPDKYKKWVEEEVVYIITSKEKEVFLQLETDKEREIFIEAFWTQRDPTSGTPKNEFKEEHYRRFQYANEFFGRGTPKPGWRTEQGRIYIILGQPMSIETHENVMNVYPTQVWSYLGDPKYGLPPAFNIVFFKKYGLGEYDLYSPSVHGPQSLIADYMGDAKDTLDAYQRLSELAPDLAKYTLTLIPGERSMPGFVSLASNKLFSDVYSFPQKKIEDDYAEAILRYKDIVEVEYTANYIRSDSLVKVIKDDKGFFLVHYSVEPKKLSVDYYGDKYSAYFELDGRISDLSGKTIFQYSKGIPLSFSQEQIKDIESKSFALQDMFPLVPGHYRFDLLVKNTVAKEFTSLEENITVPQDSSVLQISTMILGYKVESGRPGSDEIVPFKVGENQILCQPREIFTAKDSLFVFFQILGLSPEVKSRGAIKFAVLKRDEEVISQTKEIKEYQSDKNFIEEIILNNFSPDYYRIIVSVLDEDGKEILFESEDFEITHATDISRPLVISKVMPAAHGEEYTFTLGIQRLNQGDLKEATSLLGKAYHKNPNLWKYALGYSQALFVNQEYQKVKKVLMPFVGTQDERAETLYFLGKATHSLGQFEEALSYYEKYLSRFGMNLEILNLIGTCHYKLGNTMEALKTWEKSLEINSGQTEIKKLVESLKEKK